MSLTTIESPPVPCRQAAGWRSQFGNPCGWRGWLVGHLMAIKNRKRSLWVLSLLGLRPTDRILELGFGPGVDIRRIADRVPKGFVAGIDHSEEMVRQASRRNARAIRAGRVELRRGTAAELPYAPDSFDTVLSINAAQFWDKPAETACEIRRILKPGGHVALAVQPRNKGATEEAARETGRKLVEALTTAGFTSVMLHRRPLKPVSAVCAFATK